MTIENCFFISNQVTQTNESDQLTINNKTNLFTPDRVGI